MSSLHALLANRKAVAGLVILGLILLLAVLGPLFTPDPLAYLGDPLEPPSVAHWLGTSGQGQDVLAQTL